MEVAKARVSRVAVAGAVTQADARLVAQVAARAAGAVRAQVGASNPVAADGD